MKSTLLLLAGMFVAITSYAQNSIHHMDVFVQTHLTESTTIENADTLRSVTEQKEPQMFVVLSDTANISSFTVKLGTTSGAGDILEKTFSFTEEGEFQDGTAFFRDGNYVRIILGRYPVLPNYYAQVRATVNGSQQSPISYSAQ